MFFCRRISSFLKFCFPHRQSFNMMGRHRRAHIGSKTLQTRSGYPPVTPFVSSQFLMLCSGAQGVQEATPQDSVSCCLLDFSPSLSHSNNIRSHCKIHLTFSLSNQQSSVAVLLAVCAVVTFCNITNFRADSDFDEAAICRQDTDRDVTCHGSNTPSDSTRCYGHIAH